LDRGNDRATARPRTGDGLGHCWFYGFDFRGNAGQARRERFEPAFVRNFVKHMSLVTPEFSDQDKLHKQHRFVGLLLAGLVVTMVGVSFAAVPLYRIFCQVTGYGGTTQSSDIAPATVLDQVMTVRFDSNVNRGLAWDFSPAEVSQEIKIGETGLAFYRATNLSDKVLVGTATFNVTPQAAGYYFTKIDCFCFTEQVLQPGETVDMPVTYFIDPEIVDDKNLTNVNTITLSYTFFPKPDAATAVE